MILNSWVLVKLNSKNTKYYEDLGYTIPRSKNKWGKLRIEKDTQINVKLQDLQKGSNTLVNVTCDNCQINLLIQYLTYNRNQQDNLYYCHSCSMKIKNGGSNNWGFKNGNRQYQQYCWSAKKRALIFELTSEEFNIITCKPCRYCGQKLKIGIDRVDNKQGYIISNCVPCCETCNRAKLQQTAEEYINKCVEVAKYSGKV